MKVYEKEIKNLLFFMFIVLLAVQLGACSRKTSGEEEAAGKRSKIVTLNIYMPVQPPYYLSQYAYTLLKEVLEELNKKAEKKMNIHINIANLDLVSGADGSAAVIRRDTGEALDKIDCDMLFHKCGQQSDV